MRRFAEQDQDRFARLSGDWNPMHMDPVAARRTQAGAPVVHGVHLTLWTLDTLIRDGVVAGPVASVQAVFNKFVYLDTPTEIRVVRVADDAIEAIVSAAGVDTTTVTIGLGVSGPAEAGPMDQPSVVTQGRVANVPELSAMAKQSGWMEPEGSEDLFPHATRLLGARRVGAIALTSRLVGMLYPGLHSVFGSLDIAIVPEHPRLGLGFHVAMANVRTRLLRMPVAGSGISGTVIAFARREAVVQPGMPEIVPHVAAGSFAGAVALVTGLVGGTLTWALGRHVNPFTINGTNVILVGFLFVLVHLQHSHIWIAFRGVLGRVVMSPAAHQLHHSSNLAHFGANFGSCLAIWDWMFGTLNLPSATAEKLTFGAARPGERPHSVTGGLLAPFAESLQPSDEVGGGLFGRPQPMA